MLVSKRLQLASAACLWLPLVSCFSWSPRAVVSYEPGEDAQAPLQSMSPSEMLRLGTRRPLIYELALNELQELEAEPLCHRVAARLLVNNCQLLEGKDDATVHTNSDRKARDFVDAYAASLAICDLERASFDIPQACRPFREPTLSTLPLGDTAQLHVSSAQIKACLTGLGDSPSAWNTWVSYSHKAVRFCEAARADHEKTQNILLFQRLTRVMAKLTDDVEAELQKRMDMWDAVAEQTSERLSHLAPQADQIWQRLKEVEVYLDENIQHAFRRAEASATEGYQTAQDLQKLLSVMTKAMLDNQARMAAEHEQALEQATGRVSSEMGVVATSILAVLSSAASLQDELEMSRLRAADLAAQQEGLEKGMKQLTGLAQTLSSRYTDHTYLLAQANNLTSDMLYSLDATAALSSTIRASVLQQQRGVAQWWPHFVLPSLSLILGSYGLPPSLLRNIGLLAFGELLGFVVSSFAWIGQAAGVLSQFPGPATNATDLF